MPEIMVGNSWGEGKKSRSMTRCKPCSNPDNYDHRPRYLPAGFTEYVLSSVSGRCPPFHETNTDVEPHVDIERLRLALIVTHQFVQGWGGKLAVLYQTQWVGLTSTPWDRESESRRNRRAVLPY